MGGPPPHDPGMWQGPPRGIRPPPPHGGGGPWQSGAGPVPPPPNWGYGTLAQAQGEAVTSFRIVGYDNGYDQQQQQEYYYGGGEDAGAPVGESEPASRKRLSDMMARPAPTVVRMRGLPWKATREDIEKASIISHYAVTTIVRTRNMGSRRLCSCTHSCLLTNRHACRRRQSLSCERVCRSCQLCFGSTDKDHF